MTASTYFVQSERGGPVKVGTTTGSVSRRVAQLQVGSPYPLRVVDSFPSSIIAEKEAHGDLSAFRLHGEWFEEAPALQFAAYQRALLTQAACPSCADAPFLCDSCADMFLTVERMAEGVL